jgi:hypothetical protein
MRQIFTKFLLLGCIIAAFGPASARAGLTSLYNDDTNYLGFGYIPGGATNVNGNAITSMVADGITAGPGLGGHSVDQLSFSVINFNDASIFAGAVVQIYLANGPGGGPGTLIATESQVLFLLPESLQQVTITSPNMFTMPTGLFWAGLSFNNLNNIDPSISPSAAQLNGLGPAVFSPPTVGSSPDYFFQSNSATSNGTNNPAGGFYTFGASTPPDFGWTFATAQSVPEPSSLVLSTIGGLVLVGVGLTRRRRSAGNPALAT